MVDIAERRELLQGRINLYRNVNDLFEKVRQFCEGVYYEIIVDPPEPLAGKKIILQLDNPEENIEQNYEEQPQPVFNPDPQVNERLHKIERLQNDYKFLIDRAYEIYNQLKEQYGETNCVVVVYRRQEEIIPEPPLEVDMDDEDYAFVMEHIDHQDMDSQSEWDSEDEPWDPYDEDSGIDPETDVEPEELIDGMDNYWESEDSGLQSDTDSSSEVESDHEARRG